MRLKLVHRPGFWLVFASATVLLIWGAALSSGLPDVGDPRNPVCETALVFVLVLAVVAAFFATITAMGAPPISDRRAAILVLTVGLLGVCSFVLILRRSWADNVLGAIGCNPEPAASASTIAAAGTVGEQSVLELRAIQGLPSSGVYVIAGLILLALSVITFLILRGRFRFGWYRFRGVQLLALSVGLVTSVLFAMSLGRVFVNRTDPEAVEWTLLAVGLLTLVHHGIAYFRRTQPGPVELVTVVNATNDETIKPDGLTAQLKDGLARVGLRQPPTVPGGSLPQALIDVVTESPIGQAKWIGKLLAAVRNVALGGGGHKISSTLRLRDAEPRFGLTIDISDADTGSTERIETLWGSNVDDLITSAAHVVYQEVLSHPDVIATSPWETWVAQGARGLALYEEGARHEASENVDDALEAYRKAAELEPFNTVVRLRQGTLLEETARQAEALIPYLQAHAHWKFLARVRYRLAIAYEAEDLLSAWAGLGASTRATILTLLASAEGADDALIRRVKISADDWEDALRHWFASRAVQHWEWLTKTEPDAREGFNPYDFHTAAVVGQHTTWLRHPEEAGDPSPSTLGFKKREKEVHRAAGHRRGHRGHVAPVRVRAPLSLSRRLGRPIVWRRHSTNWVAHYNAACFYSVAITAPWMADEKERLTQEALEHVSLALENRSSDFDIKWLCNDPDLENLRGVAGLEAILSVTCKERDMSGDKGDLKQLCQAWDVLSDWSRYPAEAWTQRTDEMNRWRGIERELLTWCSEEKETWHALAAWANRPLAVLRKTEFWGALGVYRSDPLAKAATPKDRFSCDESDIWQRVVAIRDHVVAWQHVEDCAEGLRDRWGELEQRVRRPNHRHLGIHDVQLWARAAHDVWEALQELPDVPSSDRIASRFFAESDRFMSTTA
jgi:tetratricopeptide (TPR) repeat protein